MTCTCHDTTTCKERIDGDLQESLRRRKRSTNRHLKKSEGWRTYLHTPSRQSNNRSGAKKRKFLTSIFHQSGKFFFYTSCALASAIGSRGAEDSRSRNDDDGDAKHGTRTGKNKTLCKTTKDVHDEVATQNNSAPPTPLLDYSNKVFFGLSSQLFFWLKFDPKSRNSIG